MKSIYNQLMVLAILTGGAVTTTSCGDDFLTAQPTESDAVGGSATESTILNDLASAYQILTMDSYANYNYNSVLLMPDLQSDDIWKGGGNAGDQEQLYKLECFQATPAQNISGQWTIYFTGLARCNNSLIAIENASGVDATLLKRFKGEAMTLKVYYESILWRDWGNIPVYDGLLAAPYVTPQLKADEVYTKMKKEIDEVIDGNYLPMATRGDLLARVNMATAKMLRARIVLYQKDQSSYAQITKDMADIISSGEYSLVKNFASIWLDDGEFGTESIFESNQYPNAGRNWGDAWTGLGTNLPEFISPSDLHHTDNTAINTYGEVRGGWGFGPVRESTYKMYEEGDTRRDASINYIPNGGKYSYSPRFQDTGYFLAKYCARYGYNPAKTGATSLNYANNVRIFRYAETLLNYVELVKMLGQSEVSGISAQSCFDQIRDRAFGDTNHRITANAANIKQERRNEFVGEGMRYYDLVRWGDAATKLTENNDAFQVHRTWTESKKYLPIPEGEINKTTGTQYPLVQNPY